jgi:hypothetical protein
MVRLTYHVTDAEVLSDGLHAIDPGSVSLSYRLVPGCDVPRSSAAALRPGTAGVVADRLCFAVKFARNS